MNVMTRYYLYAALNGLQFGWTTWLAFLLARGANPGWAETAYHLAILLCEVPTGVVADRLGRRFSMLVGMSLGAAMGFAHLFVVDTLTACIVFALSGLGSTFLSGADTALLYEAAVEEGGSELARTALARSAALQLTALSVAPVIAGFLYEWHGWAPFLARGVLSMMGIFIVWGLKDRKPEAARRSVWRHTAGAVRVILSRRNVLAIILFYGLYNTVGATVAMFGQAYFPQTGLTMVYAGAAFAGARLVSAGLSELGQRLSAARARQLQRTMPLVQSVAYAIMGLTGGWKAAALFVGGDGLDGLISPAMAHRINEEIPSAQRATILSVQGMSFSLMMSVFFPVAAYIQPLHHLYYAFGGAGVLISLVRLFYRWEPQQAQPRPQAAGGD